MNGLAIFGSLVAALAFDTSGIGWALINAEIRREFPQVRRISTSELATWLNDSRRAHPLLLDVRTPAEFAVSHLRNAMRVDPEAEASAFSVSREQAIVTYCSVGYRSGALAQRLNKAGFINVTNLDGSIFRWANENRPLYRENERVTEVHPCHRLSGLLLAPAHRANVSSTPHVAPR